MTIDELWATREVAFTLLREKIQSFSFSRSTLRIIEVFALNCILNSNDFYMHDMFVFFTSRFYIAQDNYFN